MLILESPVDKGGRVSTVKTTKYNNLLIIRFIASSKLLEVALNRKTANQTCSYVSALVSIGMESPCSPTPLKTEFTPTWACPSPRRRYTPMPRLWWRTSSRGLRGLGRITCCGRGWVNRDLWSFVQRQRLVKGFLRGFARWLKRTTRWTCNGRPLLHICVSGLWQAVLQLICPVQQHGSSNEVHQPEQQRLRGDGPVCHSRWILPSHPPIRSCLGAAWEWRFSALFHRWESAS